MPQAHVSSCPTWIPPPGSAAPHSIGRLSPLGSQPSRGHDGRVLSGTWSESLTSVPSRAGISSATESPIFCIEIFQTVKKKPHSYFLRLIILAECCYKYVLLSGACWPRPLAALATRWIERPGVPPGHCQCANSLSSAGCWCVTLRAWGSGPSLVVSSSSTEDQGLAAVSPWVPQMADFLG